jgi:hypothetical protein
MILHHGSKEGFATFRAVFTLKKVRRTSRLESIALRIIKLDYSREARPENLQVRV